MKYIKLFENAGNPVDKIFEIIDKDYFFVYEEYFRLPINLGTRDDPWEYTQNQLNDITFWNCFYLIGAEILDNNDDYVGFYYENNIITKILVEPFIPEIQRRAKDILLDKIELYSKFKNLFDYYLGDEIPDHIKRSSKTGLWNLEQ